MTNILGAIGTGIYGKLTAGTALTNLLAGTASVYNSLAPRGVSMPYVIFQYQGGGDENLCATRLRNIVYTVKAVSSTGALQAANIDAQVDALLHNATLTVTGFSNFWCAREGDIDYVETDPDAGNVWHAGRTYRIRLAET